jgi:integrase
MAKIKKPSAKARAFRHFKSCFSGLVKHRVLKENIFDYIDSIPEPSSKKAYAPEKSELMDFFSKLIKEDYETYIFAKFLSLTGLRKGEALALTWDDFDGELLKVDKAFNVVSRKVTTTKTKAGNRTIPLIPAVIKLLESLRSNNKEIFWFIPKYYVTHKFTAYAKKYELERLTLHTLRHYFTTQCYEAGIPEKVVSLWLGHSKSIVTNQVYTHINKKFETEQINIIAEYWDDEE